MSKKIAIITIILAMCLNLSLSRPASAAIVAWPDTIAQFQKQMMEEVSLQVRAALLAALKKAALDLIVDTVNNIVAGTTQAGALFIQDWEDYLFKSPHASTQAHMNDFFTITTRGKTSGNFTSACPGGESFAEWRSAGAKESVNVEVDLTSMQSTFEEYACDFVSMFNEGSWDAYTEAMKPNNNPIAYALIAQSEYEKKLEEEKKKAEAQALAYQGYIGQKENGIVIAPGTLISDITSSANTLDNLILANAGDVGEMAGIAVGKIASSVIKQGIGNARQSIQNKINSEICDYSQDLRDNLRNLTPNGSLLGGMGIGSLGQSTDNRNCVIR
ncbi:MAG: hypothetical protein PHH24_01325 [Candidatus Moranbacteria bacterium]|jgi:hypothetical protein|nr:hypothetical protein [Candidatus Moranbacteria bacterium]MDX9855514.1 hypothetical protein [Candidatus Moranbacteria bacterium]